MYHTRNIIPFATFILQKDDFVRNSTNGCQGLLGTMNVFDQEGNRLSWALYSDDELDACESPIEREFLKHLSRTSGGLSGLQQQVVFGPFRVDFLFDELGDSIAVELDGDDFHDPQKDDQRDQYLLSNGISSVIRIPGRSIYHAPNATFKILSDWYPRFKSRSDALAQDFESFVASVRIGRTLDDWIEEDFEEPSGEFYLADGAVAWVGELSFWHRYWSITNIPFQHPAFITMRKLPWVSSEPFTESIINRAFEAGFELKYGN